jgi:hypothetical protein
MKGILLDETGDIMVSGDSVVIDDVNLQIAEHIITAFQGEYKEAPLLGGNAAKILGGTPDPFWGSEVRRQLKSQGIEVELKIGENIELRINN